MIVLDTLPAALERGIGDRITYNGVPLHGTDERGVRWLIDWSTVTGFGDPEAVRSTGQRVQADGLWTSKAYRGGRAIGLEGWIVGRTGRQTQAIADVEAAIDRLLAAATLDEAPLTWHRASGDRTAYVERDGVLAIDRPLPHVVKWQLVLLAPDPSWYVGGPAREDGARVRITRLPVTSGGLIFPSATWGQALVSNLIPNPSFEAGLAGYAALNCNAEPATEQHWTGLRSAHTLWDGHSALAQGLILPDFPLEDGKMYTLSAWLYVPAGSESVAPAVRAKGDVDVVGVPVTTPGTWQRSACTWTQSGTTARLYAAVATEATSGATDVYVDGVMLTEGPLVDYFDGSTADAGGYGYRWTGEANASISEKGSVVERGLQFPLTFTGSSSTGDVVVDNPGTRGSLEFRIDGPVAEPEIVTENADGIRTLAWAQTLSPREFLIVDPYSRSSRLQGQASRPPAVRQWPRLAPGRNTFRFRSPAYSPDAQLTVTVRPAY